MRNLDGYVARISQRTLLRLTNVKRAAQILSV